MTREYQLGSGRKSLTDTLTLIPDRYNGSEYSFDFVIVDAAPACELR
jgi:hypothetical protein